MLFFAGGLLAAQTSTLRGVVTDSSGGFVPAATVAVAGPGGSAKTAADARGVYSFDNLAPGRYWIQAAAPHLILETPVEIDLAPGPRVLNLQLGLAPVVERVSVETDAPPAVATDPAANATATVLRGADLESLADDPEDLMSDLEALAGPSAGPGGGAVFIDGFSGGELPPKESIREVRLNQNPFSPEFDKLGLGRIEILTKPGADRWRGTLNFNYATEAWNSRNPYSAVKAPLQLKEWENTISGPIGKRASLTLDANQNNVDNGSIVNAVTLAPGTLAPTPFFDIFRTIQRRTRVYPRFDYQLDENKTLTFRYAVTHGDIQGAGIGGFDLTSRGYHTQYFTQMVQAIETTVLSPATVNETRFQYYRNGSQITPDSVSPLIQVLGSFNDGGSQIGHLYDTTESYELQNSTTLIHGPHAWRFGIRARGQNENNSTPYNFNGTFTFAGGLAPVLDVQNQPVLNGGQPALEQIDSIEAYRRTLLFQSMGMTPTQIRALGGGATQFSISTGTPGIAVDQIDVGIFAGDDWRPRPNLTVSLGLRYEAQTNIHDLRDFAPRIGIAWAPGSSARRGQPRLVIRGGFGIFYDRFSLINTLTAGRYNGIVQQQYVIANPDFFPAIPSAASLPSLASAPVTQAVSATLRALYVMQSAITVERQLPKNTTLAVTYANSHGLHILRSNDINAPFPGTYIPGIQDSGVYPLGHPGAEFLMESSGLYNQNQLLVNFSARVNQNISLTGSYMLNRAMSNTDGLATVPANPYNYAGEYGPAATDARQRVTLSGSINTKWNIRFSPLITLQSGLPFDITTGTDLYGTTLFNARPGIATDPTRPGVIQTSYGLLDPNPIAGEQLLRRNFGRGPGQLIVNLRVSKTIGFGAERGQPRAGAPGLRGFFSTPPADRRYNLTIAMSARNLINHTNPGPIIGTITSPLFGLANQMAGSVNAEGFSENADNRRLELQIRFAF